MQILVFFVVIYHSPDDAFEKMHLRVLGNSAIILSDSGFLQKAAHARPLVFFCLFVKTIRDP
jgi:hypothetical protein